MKTIKINNVDHTVDDAVADEIERKNKYINELQDLLSKSMTNTNTILHELKRMTDYAG